jgi:hypothetical protein
MKTGREPNLAFPIYAQKRNVPAPTGLMHRIGLQAVMAIACVSEAACAQRQRYSEVRRLLWRFAPHECSAFPAVRTACQSKQAEPLDAQRRHTCGNQRKTAADGRAPSVPPYPRSGPSSSLPRMTASRSSCRILARAARQQLANCARHTDRRTFDFCSISPNATPVEVFRLAYRKISYLQCVARNSPNPSSHQVRRIFGRESKFWDGSRQRGAQPDPQTPLKTQGNQAAAGSGERFREGEWRGGRDWQRTFSIT